MQPAQEQLSPCLLRSCNWGLETTSHSDAVHSLFFKGDCTLEEYKTFSEGYRHYHPKNADTEGWNTLCLAAFIGHIEIAKYILETNENYNCCIARMGTTFGWTPLFCACLSTNHPTAIKIASLLLAKEVDVNTTTPGRTSSFTITYSSGDSQKHHILPSVTPLWAAINISQNVSLAVNLLEAGGVGGPNF